MHLKSENIVYEMAAILSMGRWVNKPFQKRFLSNLTLLKTFCLKMYSKVMKS